MWSEAIENLHITHVMHYVQVYNWSRELGAHEPAKRLTSRGHEEIRLWI